MAKEKKQRQKKQQTRVDFTPMVDMMMLLITFFMLCTTLAKPQTMELSMPTNDKNLSDQDKSVTKASYTITMYVTADNQIYYIAGLPSTTTLHVSRRLHGARMVSVRSSSLT